jgi:hypothetical protein
LGTAIASYFVPADKQQLLTIILASVWLLGWWFTWWCPACGCLVAKVMAMTGELHLASPLYWTHVVVGLALPLAVLAWQRRIPVWLPVLLLVGEFAGRIIFFSLVISSAANLGGLY